MDAIWTYVQHAYLIPSYMVGSFFLVILVILTERKNLTATLVWGGLFSLCPYMALSDGIYHGTLYLLSQMMGNIPLLADVILDYMSRLVLIPVAIYVFQKKLSIHWSLSLFFAFGFWRNRLFGNGGRQDSIRCVYRGFSCDYPVVDSSCLWIALCAKCANL